MEPFDLDKFMEYMIVTDQVDETFGLKQDNGDDDKDTKDDTFQKKIGTWEDEYSSFLFAKILILWYNVQTMRGGLVMQFNDALITHYREGIIPLYTLRGLVELNDAYLKEKPTWYVINREVKYFKARGDLRLFSELFFTEFARDIIGLDTLDYEVAHVRTLDAKVKPSQEERKTGLLSTNFQTKDNNYYLVSELYDPEICGLTGYGNYNLQNLLSFFRDGVASEDYKNIESFLTKLFLADGFTLQVDRNPNNIGFQIPILWFAMTQRVLAYDLSIHHL